MNKLLVRLANPRELPTKLLVNLEGENIYLGNENIVNKVDMKEKGNIM